MMQAIATTPARRALAFRRFVAAAGGTRGS